MEQFEGRVAVVTGGASGMGFAFAERFAREGMRVVVADIEEQALDDAVDRLRAGGAQIEGVVTDVSDADAVEALASRAYERFGAVHVLCNNAGVMADEDLGDVFGRGEGAKAVWELSLETWHWTFGVNFWGVVHGIRSFLPRMLEGGEPGHVVNTASIAGLASGALVPIYGASKHAVVRVSEALYAQLRQLDAPLSASVLCPGTVNTRISISSRNRPGALWGDEQAPSSSELDERQEQWVKRSDDIGMGPEEVASRVLDAIRDDRFYILPHEGSERAVEARMRRILEGRNPR